MSELARIDREARRALGDKPIAVENVDADSETVELFLAHPNAQVSARQLAALRRIVGVCEYILRADGSGCRITLYTRRDSGGELEKVTQENAKNTITKQMMPSTLNVRPDLNHLKGLSARQQDEIGLLYMRLRSAVPCLIGGLRASVDDTRTVTIVVPLLPNVRLTDATIGAARGSLPFGGSVEVVVAQVRELANNGDSASKYIEQHMKNPMHPAGVQGMEGWLVCLAATVKLADFVEQPERAADEDEEASAGDRAKRARRG